MTAMTGGTGQPNKIVSLPSNTTTSAEPMSTLKTIAQEAINRAAGLENDSSPAPTPVDTRQQQQQQQQVQLFADANVTNGPNSGLTSSSLVKVRGTNEAHIPPLLGVAPLGQSPLLKEHQLQFQMMEAAYYHLPTPSDSERLRTYLHRNPIQTPTHYPQVMISIAIIIRYYIDKLFCFFLVSTATLGYG